MQQTWLHNWENAESLDEAELKNWAVFRCASKSTLYYKEKMNYFSCQPNIASISFPCTLELADQSLSYLELYMKVKPEHLEKLAKFYWSWNWFRDTQFSIKQTAYFTVEARINCHRAQNMKSKFTWLKVIKLITH